MRAREWWPVILLVAGCLGLVAAGEESGPSAGASALAVIEGRVVAMDEAEGEGGLRVVRLRLEGDGESHLILLAPAPVLAEIDFPVEAGDRIRARAFVTGNGGEPIGAAVHKIMNLTRRRMVRLRTLHRDPLWDGNGVWQGAPGRRHGGGRGHRGREEGGRGGGG